MTKDTDFNPFAGTFDEPESTGASYLNLSKVPDGTYFFTLGIGNPATNRDKNVKTYAGNDGLKSLDCLLFTNEAKGQFVAKWYYTGSPNDVGHRLGLDKRPSFFDATKFNAFPQVVWTIPMLWNVTLTDDEDEKWDEQSGEVTLMQMSEAQWKNIVEVCGDVKAKYRNVQYATFKLVRDSSAAPADRSKWSLYDVENKATEEQIAAYVGNDFTFAELMQKEQKSKLENTFFGLGEDGVANVWAMLEEKTGLTQEQILANPLYNYKLNDSVGAQVNEVDLSLDT